jgi:hypothetical protein
MRPPSLWDWRALPMTSTWPAQETWPQPLDSCSTASRTAASGRGQVELSRRALSSKQQPMVGGQAFGWDRKAPGSSVLLAASLALWGVDAADVARPPRRRPDEGGERRATAL